MSDATGRTALADVDVLVIGAGINGSAAARELSARGYSVMLVDRQDLGGATTARSGRVLHCGLQILAPNRSIWDYLWRPADLAMRLRQARQTALDFEEWRARPELLLPMSTSVPLPRAGSLRGWQVDLGAALIRVLGARDFAYRRTSGAAATANPYVSTLANADLDALVSFRDYRIHWPERIAIDAALDAEDMGAMLRPFTEVASLHSQADGSWLAGLRDVSVVNSEVSVRARYVLNLAGVRVDEVLSHTRPSSPKEPKIVAVKGVYLLIKLSPAFRGLGLAAMNRLGEPLCCLPWGNLHYVGPTETRFEGDFDEVRPEQEDLDFLFAELRAIAPGLQVSRDDLVMAWAGLRAITSAPGYPKGKRLPFNVVMDLAREGLPNMATLSWGIIVNHRSTARTVAKLVARSVRPSRAATTSAVLRHGLPGGGIELQEGSGVTFGDVRHCVANEYARDLYGVLASRTGLVWTGQLTRGGMERALAAMAQHFGWSAERTAQEGQSFIDRMRRDHLFEI